MTDKNNRAACVETIGEGGQPPDGWVIHGHHGFDLVRVAVDHHSGFAVTPHHVLCHTVARLECFECGPLHRTKTGHLKGCEHNNDDGEGLIWNFRVGKPVTIVMRDGRSVHLHFPWTMKDAQS